MAVRSRSAASSSADFEPPAHLSLPSQALWRRLVPRRAKSPGRLALLEVALQARDRADAAAGLIAVEGMVTVTKKTGLAHVNPLVKVEKDSRQLFARCWSDLHLGWDEVDAGRWGE